MKVAVTLLVVCVAALLALGMVMLYSSKMVETGANGGVTLLMKQLVWCGLGLAGCLTMASLDYALLRKFAWPIFGFAGLLLALVLVPNVGLAVNGSRRWLGFGGFRFQPSELGKLALIVVTAWYCERYQRQLQTWKRGIIMPGIIIGSILLLIFVEPDRGATILLAAVLSVLLIIGGVRWQYFLLPVVLGVAGLAISFAHDPMRSARIYSWLHLEETKLGKGLQVYQAMLAFGSGGWTGLGLGNGRQKLGWVPEQHTDFILSLIGEELGLVATLFVVVAFIVIVICGVHIALRARDNFGLILGCGITFLIGFQAFINIGVVTGVLPNKGLSLPFISYGGSNLLIMLICVGVLLSVARHARDPIPIRDVVLEPANPFATQIT